MGLFFGLLFAFHVGALSTKTADFEIDRGLFWRGRSRRQGLEGEIVGDLLFAGLDEEPVGHARFKGFGR